MVVPKQVSGFIPETPSGGQIKSLAERGIKIAVKAGIAGFVLLAAHNAVKPMLPEVANKAIDVFKPAVIGAATGDAIGIGVGAMATGERAIAALTGYSALSPLKKVTETKVSGFLGGQESF